MKKLIFTALAAVFMLSSGFSSVEENSIADLSVSIENQSSITISSVNFEDGGMCRYSITRTWRDAAGDTQSETKYYSFWSTSEDACNARANDHVTLLSLSLMEF